MKETKTKVFTIRSDIDIARTVSAISKLKPTQEHQYFVKVSLKGENRRDKQNRLSFMWYAERGEQSGNGKQYERNYCKLTHGCAILLSDYSGRNDAFVSFFTQLTEKYTYEQLIQSMEFIEVTSLMTVKQFAEYLTAVEREAVQQGWRLTHPDDIYYESLMREVA